MTAPRRLLPLFIAFAMVVAASVGRADEVQDARGIVQGIADQGLDVLKRPDSTARHKAFLTLFTDNFNTVAIGRFVLGPYREGLAPPDFDRFMAVFQDLVAKTYAVQLGQYAGEQFKLTNSRTDNSRWVVESQITPHGRSAIHLDWVLARGKDGLKVVDVRVDNLSMALTQRDEFASVLQANGGHVDRLISFMQDKIKKIDAGA